MKLRTLFRHIREGYKNVIRNGWMSFASVSSVFISLFILGVFILISFNINAFTRQVESTVQIKVYLELSAKPDEVETLRSEIGLMSEVSKVVFISKEEGMKMLRKWLKDGNEQILQGYDETNNPLPDAFTVEVFSPEKVGQVARKIEELNEKYPEKIIFKVKYGKGTVETLFDITSTFRTLGIILVIGLSITAMFIISNTIRITIMARQREIGIMKLVGATNRFIRGPFFIEGALIGFIGSVTTLVVLLVGYDRLVMQTHNLLGIPAFKLVPVYEVFTYVVSVIAIFGVLIGIWGSMVSIRKFLKV